MGRCVLSSYQLPLLGGPMPADFSPPFPALAEAAASRPSPEQMQRINFYGSLCQAPDCSHGVGCSYPAAPWGSWEERLVGDARAPGRFPKQEWPGQGSQMKLRMSHTMDTETGPQVGPPSGQCVPGFNASCRCSMPCIYSLSSNKDHLFIPFRKETWLGHLPLCVLLLPHTHTPATSQECVCHTCPLPGTCLWHMNWRAQTQGCHCVDPLTQFPKGSAPARDQAPRRIRRLCKSTRPQVAAYLGRSYVIVCVWVSCLP